MPVKYNPHDAILSVSFPGGPMSRLLAAFAAVYLIWGSTYMAIRIAIDAVPPYLMIGLRCLLAGGILLAWAFARGVDPPTRRQWTGALPVGGLLFLVGQGGLAWAETRVPTGVAALLIATTPIWMVLMAGGRGAPRSGPRTAAAIGLGTAGVVILAGPAGFLDGGAVDPGGSAVLLLAAFSWAAGSVLSRRLDRPRSNLLATGLDLVAGGTLLVGWSAAIGEPAAFDLSSLTTRSIAAFVYLVIFGSVVTFTAYNWLLRNTTIARAASYVYVNPIVALAIGWGIGGEAITPRVVAAAAVLVLAVVLIVTDAPVAPKARAGPPGPRNQEGGREVIARIWHGRTRKADADTYGDYMMKTGGEAVRGVDGFRGVYLLRQIDGDTADFLFVSLWDSIDSVRNFAGPSPEKAVYYPEDDRYLLEREPHVRHYEVVQGPDGARRGSA